MLRAVGILAAQGRPVHLLHLSGGHKEFLSLATSLGVDRHVIAGDAVAPFAALADHYCASDVCVQSSVEEGLGFSPLEALACGVPVVATAVGGLNDTIRNGETGWQVPLGDADALANAIVDILDGAEEAARRTRAGAAAVERSYDRRLVFEAFVNRLAGDSQGTGSGMTTGDLNVAVVADLLEERWPSMDLMADMLMTYPGTNGSTFRPALIRPEFGTTLSSVMRREQR